MKVYTMGVSKFIDLFHSLLDTEIKQIIVHSFDTAKGTIAIARRVGISDDPCSIYLSGLLHDVGFVLYGNVKNIETFRKMVGNVDVADQGIVVFDISMTLDALDSKSEHALVSYAMSKDLLPERCAIAVLNHHTPDKSREFGEKAAKLTYSLTVADVISNVYRREVRNGESEAVRQVLKAVESMRIPFQDVASAAVDFVRDPIDFAMMVDTEPHLEHFVDKKRNLNVKEIMGFFKIFVYLVDFRSPFTRDHSYSIAMIARDIGAELLKSEFDSTVLYTAGLVHDIGKIRTPLEILHKPGRLDPYELMVMKRHIADTIRMTYHMNEISEILQTAYLHHERLDGSGYPYGLKESEIPMKARIMQISDVFVALTEDRPYRKGLDYSEALSIIEKQVDAGKLDPDVFEKLKEMVKSGYRIPKRGSIIEEIFGKKVDEDALVEVFEDANVQER